MYLPPNARFNYIECLHYHLGWLPIPHVGIGSKRILGCLTCHTLDVGFVDNKDFSEMEL